MSVMEARNMESVPPSVELPRSLLMDTARTVGVSDGHRNPDSARDT
jgi:hypothetical protein